MNVKKQGGSNTFQLITRSERRKAVAKILDLERSSWRVQSKIKEGKFAGGGGLAGTASLAGKMSQMGLQAAASRSRLRVERSGANAEDEV